MLRYFPEYGSEVQYIYGSHRSRVISRGPDINQERYASASSGIALTKAAFGSGGLDIAVPTVWYM
jgi:hypothetical protein